MLYQTRYSVGEAVFVAAITELDIEVIARPILEDKIADANGRKGLFALHELISKWLLLLQLLLQLALLVEVLLLGLILLVHLLQTRRVELVKVRELLKVDQLLSRELLWHFSFHFLAF